jgi:glycolate oxidase iron-sulfur subunit
MIQDIQLLQSEEYQKKLTQCIHCGLCLQACPTYAVFGTEMDAPRGRISLMRAASQGRIGLEDFKDAFSRHIMLCLACRACETACPSGVQYGALVETARIVVEHNRQPGFIERGLRWFGTQQLMPKLWLLKFVARLMWIYEKIGLQKIVRKLNFLPGVLKIMEGILPPITLRFTPHAEPIPAEGVRYGKVLFFTGCIQEAFLAAVNQATLRVLQHNGFEVYTPEMQTCCGAAHIHLGDVDGAKQLARQNIDVFLANSDQYDAIICNAGGCGLALKEYPHLLQDDPKYAELAEQFSANVQDVNEFLFTHLHTPPTGKIEKIATYADSCHLRHGQGIVKQPRELLKSIPGLKYVELQHPDRCCGSAGVYNIAQVDTANEVLDAKIEDIASTGAELVITSNTGCHMQLMAGLRQAGLQADVMHVVEVLDLSYQAQESQTEQEV